MENNIEFSVGNYLNVTNEWYNFWKTEINLSLFLLYDFFRFISLDSDQKRIKITK